MYIIMGNGESRQEVDYSLLENHITYGCNALYRDWTPNVLVAIDNKMMHEIVVSSYCLTNKCYFRDYVLLPTSSYSIIRNPITQDSNITIVCNEINDYGFMFFGQEKISEFYDKTKTMVRVDKPLYYFTWVTKEDQIENLDDYIGKKAYDSGQCATRLCIKKEKPDKIYLLGFDLSNNKGKVNNIYKSTECYAPSYANAVDSRAWIQDLNIIFDKYSEIDFVHVQDNPVFDNIETVSIKEFKKIL